MPVPLDADVSSDDEIVITKKKRQTFIKSDESDNDDDTGVPVLNGFAAELLNANEDAVDGVEEKLEVASEPKRNLKDLFANKDLYDAESSDEDVRKNETHSTLQEPDNYDAEGSSDEGSKQAVKETPPKKVRVSKPNKSSKPKDDVDQIHSETQRLIRHARVNLPYHKPRQRSIQDFLQRRPSIPAKSLRMSVDELELLGKHVEKRVKEAEEFYKSSSEEEVPRREEEQKATEQSKTESEVLSSIAGDNDSSVCKTSVETILLDDTPCSEQVFFSSKPQDKSSRDTSLTELESQDLVLKIDDSETCDLVEKKSNQPFAQVMNVMESSASKDKDLDLEELECMSDKKQFIGSEYILNSTDIDTQDLHLHFSESETCDLLDNTAKKSSIAISKQSGSDPSSTQSNSILPSNNEGKENFSLTSTETTEDTNTLKLMLVEDETCSILGQFERKQNIDSSGSSKELEEKENPKIILEGEDAASMSLLVTKTGCVENSSKVNQTNKEFIFRIPSQNDYQKATGSTRDSCSLTGIDDNVAGAEKRTLSFLKEDKYKLVPSSFKIQDTVPCLKGSPSKVVDLDDTPTSSGIKEFMQRFMRHSLPPTPKIEEKNVELSIVTAETGENGEPEVKKETLTVKAENDLGETKARLAELKQELQKQIVKQREEERSKRQLEMQETNADEQDEEDEKSECGLLDNEEEMEDYVTSSSEEDEEEEDDVEMKEKKKNKIKSAFIDDEAEVSEDEFENDNESLVDLSDNNEDNDKENLQEEEESVKINEEDTCKRTETELPVSGKAKMLRRIKTFDPFQSDDSSNEASEFEESLTPGIPPYQPGGAVSQIVEPTERGQFLPNIIAPTLPTQLPMTKFLENDSDPPERIFSPPSQSPGLLAGLGIQTSSNNEDIEDAELLDLCSGKFTSQLPSISQDEDLESSSQLQPTLPLGVEGDICGTVPPITQSQTLFKVREKEFEEVEQTTSPNNLPRIIESSDEEDASEDRRPKKSHKKLNFSDDESGGEDDFFEKSGSELGEPLEVEYDSEENEITVDKEEIKDFFEDEAELTESEWDSADEDEKGLDDIEMEAADDENLDQEQVKEQLGKIHMRRVLDEDQKEVRRLQELLLEDGEFHSETGGRQRQFRWKNLNNIDDLDFAKKSDEEDILEENNEDEEQWRRMRFERETFLREQKNKEESEEIVTEVITMKLKRSTAIQPRVKVQRGSFLARSEAALARIAQITRNSADTNISGPTNSRNFVFATLSEEEKVINEKQQAKKRKAPEEEIKTKKKTCLVKEGLLDKIGY